MIICACSVYVQLLDRAQQKLQLVLIPVECFCSSNSLQDLVMEMEDVPAAYLSLPPIQVIYEDTSAIWVNVSSQSDIWSSLVYTVSWPIQCHVTCQFMFL